jgi:hypothetical protein
MSRVDPSVESYISEAASRVLSNPKRSRDFLKTCIECLGGMVLSWDGRDYEISSDRDVERLPDEAAVWIARGQFELESWSERIGKEG